jgi:TolB-like protein/DNA-binding winged helix-turn-helix (wHTH) protein/thioredoxin-like negative regulator of GroEL
MGDRYRFGRFTLDPRQRALTHDGSPIPITPKAFDILLYCVQHPSRILTKQDLMKAVWPDTIVEEGNLTQNISLLRKALAEHGDASGLIVTVGRQGYQFTGTVAVVPSRTRRYAPTRWRAFAMSGAVVVATVIGVPIAWQRLRGAPAGADTVRLAVLPFMNLTGDSAEDLLADGLTEETITQLARLRPEQLRVIARTSVMGYKHGGERIDEIGRDLSVGYALESSLRQSANRLRVTVQLIRVKDQSHVWASDFDYAQQDIFHIEDGVAAAVAREVQLRLTPVQRARLARAPSSTASAVDAVIRGRSAYEAYRGQEGWRDAKRYFDAAIAADSSYALAWAWLGAVYRFGADREWIPTEPGYREARQAINRALALDPSLPEAWDGLGQIQRLVDWDWTAANTSYQRALALDSSNVSLIERASHMKRTMGDLDDALALEQRAIELDPLDVDLKIELSSLYLSAGRPGEAIKTFDAIPLDQQKNRPDYRIYLDLVTGHVADAASVLPQVADPEWQLLFRAMIAVRQGRRRTADSVLTAFVNQYHTHDAFQIAEVYGMRGDADSTFLWLDRAYAQRDQGLVDVKAQPFFNSVRGDPRYAAFLRKMRLPL